MALSIAEIALPAPQKRAKSPVIKHVDYVSVNETILRDIGAGPNEWSYYLQWESLQELEFEAVRSAWEAIIATESEPGEWFIDIDTSGYYVLPDNAENLRFTYTMYNGRVSTNPSYTVLYDCTLLFRAQEAIV